MTPTKPPNRRTLKAGKIALLAVLCGCSAGQAGTPFDDGDMCTEDCTATGGSTNVPATGGSPAYYGTGGTTGTGGNLATGGAGGSSTQPQPTSRPYDPNVTFEWPETVPNGGTSCQPGRYVGTFTCNYTPPGADAGAAAAPFPITGPIEITLLEGANGEFLEVTGGALTGNALLAITFTGKVSGTLDCSSGLFEGLVYDGSYGILPFPPGGFFEGPTTASYSATGPSLVNGTWDFNVKTVDGVDQGSCVGTWTATYTP